MAAAYKSLKEDFVSNLTGGDISAINYVATVAPVSPPNSIQTPANCWFTGCTCPLVRAAVKASLLYATDTFDSHNRLLVQCYGHPLGDHALRV
jgi:hypothetical protein